MSALIIANRSAAQSDEDIVPLSVRPRAMATAARTERAGEFLLDSLPEFLVYVPQQCVGARRCPLLVHLGGSGAGSRYAIDWQRPVADKYGMIVLGPTPADGRSFDWGGQDKQNLDAAMKQVLRRFAIDPAKIALIGRCGGGPNAFVWGMHNMDVFSRIVEISGNELDVDTLIPPNPHAEFFVDEQVPLSEYIFRHVQELRRMGHRAETVVAMRTSHDHQREDYDFIGRVLLDSWTVPGVSSRPVVPDSLTPLTPEALDRMTTFWTRFQRAPDSIRIAARRAYQKRFMLPVGEERVSVGMVDLPILAARYPSVAAALEQARLTAQEHDAYRIALLSAILAYHSRNGIGAVDPASVSGKNVAFVEAHPDELATLEATKIWDTP